jgi:hypothetical protein
MLSYNVNQVLNTNKQNRKMKGDIIGLTSVNTQFLINRRVWIGISIGISIFYFNADTISKISSQCRNLLVTQFLPKKRNDGKNG